MLVKREEGLQARKCCFVKISYKKIINKIYDEYKTHRTQGIQETKGYCVV